MFDGLHQHRFTPKCSPGAPGILRKVSEDVSRNAKSKAAGLSLDSHPKLFNNLK